ncbi:gastrokine-2-like isoform X2 [Protopterus annectens]|uniref:gastrokine-2-like isoform X2 n=1 Tax=Protopterus annectens TaxID=7888 RepID=UPI001CFB8FA8|nr:gastrokine-2-like isoform X2 [Protopterus annectens]
MDTSSKTELTMEPPIFQQTITGSNGEKTDQTVTVSSKENVATFYSTIGNTSATVVYDYNRNLLAYKVTNSSSCLVVNLTSDKFPSLKEVADGFQNGDAQNSNTANDGKKLTISATSQVVDRNTLGSTMNILCANDQMYWAVQGNGNGRLYYYCYCLYYYYYSYPYYIRYCYYICYYYY